MKFMFMMTNFFSVFDLLTSNSFSLNWMSMMISISMLQMPFWLIPSRMYMVCNWILFFIIKEFKVLIQYFFSNIMHWYATFLFILFNNFMFLFLYIFTALKHLSLSLSLYVSYFFWAYFYLFLFSAMDSGQLSLPLGIKACNPYDILFLNTIVLVSSGILISWTHYSIMNSNFTESSMSLVITILLGMYFTCL